MLTHIKAPDRFYIVMQDDSRFPNIPPEAYTDTVDLGEFIYDLLCAESTVTGFCILQCDADVPPQDVTCQAVKDWIVSVLNDVEPPDFRIRSVVLPDGTDTEVYADEVLRELAA